MAIGQRPAAVDRRISREQTASGRRPASGRRAITGRGVLLGAVVVLVVVLLAAPLHRYLGARSGLQQVEQQSRSSQQQLSQLRQQESQFADPAYIEQQARIRLQYALPGDTVYTIVAPGQQPGIDSSPSAPTAPTKVPGITWNQRLWGSVQEADGSK